MGKRVDKAMAEDSPMERDELRALLEALEGGADTLVDRRGRTVKLGPTSRQSLMLSTKSLLRMKSMRTRDLSEWLTTWEAGQFLGVSRPTLVKILEANRIPYETPTPSGTHRRVRLSDLMAFQDRAIDEAAARVLPALEARREKAPVEWMVSAGS
jgi:excisionase family DNA binding protein